MAERARARRLARTLAGWLPAGVRGVAAHHLGPSLARRLGLDGADVGLVSLVVVVEPADLPRLADCLAAVRGQRHALLDVVVVPVADAPVRLDSVAGDPRFRVRASEDSWANAANAGARSARGTYLGFVRGCDVLTPHAVSALAGSLSRSGSVLAAGRLEQLGNAETWLERSQAVAHAQPATAVGALGCPDLLGDLAIGNKLVRTGAWSEAGLAFDASDDWLSAPTWLGLLVSDPPVDILETPVVRHAHDHGNRPFGAQPSSLPELEAWLDRSRLLEGRVAAGPLATGWLRHVLDVGLPRFLQDVERADSQQWRRLVGLAAEFERRDAEVLAAVRVESRTLLRLAASGRRDDLQDFVAETLLLGDDIPTRLVGDRLVADWSSTKGRLPESVLALSEAESDLRARVVRSVRIGPTWHADVQVRVRGLDLAAYDSEITAIDDDGTTVPVERRPDVTADRWARSRFQSAAAGAVRLQLPSVTPDHPVTVTLRLRSGELERTGRVTVPVPTSANPDPRDGVVVRGVGLDQRGLSVEVTGAATGMSLTGPHGAVIAGAPNGPEVCFPLTDDLYGRSVHLSSAAYALAHPSGVWAGAELWDALPVEVVGPRHRLRLVRGAEPGALVLHLGPPIADDEVGPWAQQRLRSGYAAATGPTDPELVYFESYAGRSATDSPLAILEELRARRPGLRAAWGVLDHAQWVPDGVEAVVLRTRRWYDVLARAGVLVTNTELEEWYVRRPDQLVVQTFHGHPSKAMGQSQWQARQLPPSRVRLMRARSVDTWDLILTPSPAMTRHYRAEYGYTGAVHEHGYPRDDALLAAGADDVRRSCRRLLGIREDQTAVLYAPTWRDHLATRPRAAAMSDHLDVEEAARALGDSHVLLLRGHRFHPSTRGLSDPGAARVVDVTAHPEINDLILAADVAVLDYSSLRFDFAQTSKPMVFLVPDLEEYAEGLRGFLFPFRDSAPGPLVRSTADVVAAVRDVDALRNRWAGELRSFNATYNAWQDGRAAGRVVDRLTGLQKERGTG